MIDGIDGKFVKFPCLNGPCEGRRIPTPMYAGPGHSCAITWTNLRGEKRYAVYHVIDHQGQRGLLYLESYTTAHRAQQKVDQLSKFADKLAEVAHL